MTWGASRGRSGKKVGLRDQDEEEEEDKKEKKTSNEQVWIYNISNVHMLTDPSKERPKNEISPQPPSPPPAPFE